MKSTSVYKLQHPLFLLSILLLICNDFYFKQAFGNVITGKLSDIAGLFAFPFFFSCIFTQWKRAIHILTVILFLFWKSAFSQPIIDLINLSGITIGRVVDYTDYIALGSIFFSYRIVSKEYAFTKIKPIYTNCIIVISALSFMATSIAPKTAVEYTSVDKIYGFNVPMEEFIQRFNDLQKKEIGKITSKPYSFGNYNEDKKVFFSNNGDTLTYLIDLNKHSINDTITINNYLASFQIYPIGDNITILKLINIATFINSSKLDRDSLNIYPTNYSSRRYPYYAREYTIVKADTTEVSQLQQKALKEFEKWVIDKLK